MSRDSEIAETFVPFAPGTGGERAIGDGSGKALPSFDPSKERVGRVSPSEQGLILELEELFGQYQAAEAESQTERMEELRLEMKATLKRLKKVTRRNLILGWFKW
jgi:hypothetical protein